MTSSYQTAVQVISNTDGISNGTEVIRQVRGNSKVEKKKITRATVCQIVTSRPSLGTQSHLSSGFNDVGVVDHEPLDTSGRRGGAPSARVRMPTWDETISL